MYLRICLVKNIVFFQQRKETSCRHSNAFKTPSEMYDSDAGEVSTTDMNPDDIRAEFRR